MSSRLQDLFIQSGSDSEKTLMEVDTRRMTWKLWARVCPAMLPILLLPDLRALEVPVSGVWVGLACLALVGAVVAARSSKGRQKGISYSKRDTEVFRLISENAGDMIALLDLQGKQIYSNPAYERVLGYSPEELETAGAIERVHTNDREKVKEIVEQARRFGISRRLEYRMKHKDGTWRVLECSASIIRNEKGQVDRVVTVSRDITERKNAEEKLEYGAFHDTLTDLPNRSLFLNRLEHSAEYAKRHKDYKFAMLFLQIQPPKNFEETAGRAAADKLIVDISQRLKECLREDDSVTRSTSADGSSDSASETLARLDAEQFTILLDGIKDPSDPMRVAMRVQQGLSTPFVADGVEVFATASIGIAIGGSATNSGAEIMRDADLAMRRAKAQGESKCQVFDEKMHAQGTKRLQREAELKRALVREEFLVFYQPIVEMKSGRITGCEALMRWKHPELGVLGPAEFMDLAEETGLIVPIGKWVLKEACSQTKLWQSLFPGEAPLTVTVNASMRQFAQGELVTEIKDVLQETGITANSLQIELTETMAMVEPKSTKRMLTQLRDIGVRVSLDDFGTGHSSLNSLRELPLDSIKIDKSFVKGLEGKAENLEIAKLITALGQLLQLSVVAEGIETERQRTQLMQVGCGQAQGFLYSEAVESDRFQRLLSERNGKVQNQQACSEQAAAQRA